MIDQTDTAYWISGEVTDEYTETSFDAYRRLEEKRRLTHNSVSYDFTPSQAIQSDICTYVDHFQQSEPYPMVTNEWFAYYNNLQTNDDDRIRFVSTNYCHHAGSSENGIFCGCESSTVPNSATTWISGKSTEHHAFTEGKIDTIDTTVNSFGYFSL